MKKELIYFIFFLLLATYSCLDTPDMTGGIANMREEPTVTTKTDTAFSNENFTLTIKGEVLTQGKNSYFFHYGFCWGIDSTNLTDSIFFIKNSNTEIDTFSHDLNDLNGNLTYYWRAIAKNQYGMALGEIRKYKTPSEKPSVTSEANSDFPDEGSLLFTGKILAIGKIKSVFAKGFCWGTDAENHLTDSVFLENNSFEPGTFSYILPNVRGNTTYYWQAFAKNDYGISHGIIKTYRTPAIFEAKTDFPPYFRENFAVFSLKNILYITCGEINRNPTSETWWYEENAWRIIQNNMPGNNRRYPVAFTIGDSLAYVGTGQGLNGSERPVFGDFYIFNGNTKTWTTAPIQTPAEMPRYMAVAFSLNNKGYVVGGLFENEVLHDVWEHSIQDGTDSWKKKNDFPKPFYGGISFYNGERAFVGFGNNENTLWEYDAEIDQWHEFAKSPTYPQGESARICSGVISRNKIILLDVTNNIWELDLTTKKYVLKNKLPEIFPAYNEQNMFSIGDAIYIGTGGTALFYRYYPAWDN